MSTHGTHKKVILGLSGETPLAGVKLDALKAQLIEALGLEEEDLIVLPTGCTLHVLECAAKANKAAKKEETKS